ncbi:MAG: hypothetical protein HKP58_07920 [Desulfatitalea sp.]|nr:YkgJ family cysteine cluster protein [Desulfatitalea sp.]NNK00327.1 hypothetical protein [Desulfatitalea sp.]
MQHEEIQLSPEQAISAVCLDFRGYSPQTLLFSEILRTLFAGRITYKREPGHAGIWVSDDGGSRLRYLADTDLIEFMCRLILHSDLSSEQLVVLCRRVFQIPSRVAPATDGVRWHIVLETDMAEFQCRRCGRCCRELDYKDGMTAGDAARLETLGRKDVLKWVGITRTGEGKARYRMWVVPGTNQPAGICPFLKQGRTPDQYRCAIHDVKPWICRNYPVSRKHAMMTGCPGFDR